MISLTALHLDVFDFTAVCLSHIVYCRQGQQQPHPINCSLSGTTQVTVSRYQNGKTNLDLLEQEIGSGNGISWAMQICTSPQTDNHASTSPLSFYRPGALRAAQPMPFWLVTNLYWVVTGTRVNNLSNSGIARVEILTCEMQVQCLNHCTTRPHYLEPRWKLNKLD